MLVKMEFASFGVDPSRNTPVVVLRERGGARTLSVPVGPIEAGTVALDSLGVEQSKPMGVELAKVILESLGGRLDRLVISDGGEPGSLAAQLHVMAPSGLLLIACAPVHGVVLALRCDAPVYASEKVLEGQGGRRPSSRQALRNHIASLDTIDFGACCPE